MEAAPSAKPPPVPPNYVSLRHLQELRLKEKEEQERRRREEEEAAAAAKREAEKAAMSAAIKREAAMKVEAKRRAASWEASGGARERERHREGKAQGQGNQWVAVAHRAPASAPRPAAGGQGAARKWEAAVGGGRGETGPEDGPLGGGNPRVKAKGKGKLAQAAPAPSHGGKPDEVVPASPCGGSKPENKFESKAKRKGKGKGKGKEKLAQAAPAPSHGGEPAQVVPASPYGGGKPENKFESNSKAKGKSPGNQAAESSSIVGPGEPPAEAAILSSRDRYRRGRRAGAGGRSNEETRAGIAPANTAGPSPPRDVKSDDAGKPKPPPPRRADAVAGGDSPDGKKAGPAQVPPASAADGSRKPTSGGELRKNMEARPRGLVEGQRRRPVVETQTVGDLNPRFARRSARPLRDRGSEPVQQHGQVWVPKAAAADGSSASAGL